VLYFYDLAALVLALLDYISHSKKSSGASHQPSQNLGFIAISGRLGLAF